MVNGSVSLISLLDFSSLVYRNARDFCALIWYSATVPNSLMSRLENCLKAFKSSSSLHSVCFSRVFICLHFEQNETGNPMQSTRGTVYTRKTTQNSSQKNHTQKKALMTGE